MESIKNIYKIGYGPSSSHTMGPKFAAEQFKNENAEAEMFKVTLYGSLAATGVGHLTDVAIIDALKPKLVEIIWKPEIFLPFHPNGMNFQAYKGDDLLREWTIYSIGGGNLANEFTDLKEEKIYSMSTMDDILKYCQKFGKTFWEFVEENEGKEVYDYLETVLDSMFEAVTRGVEQEGVLPGGLFLQRKAAVYFTKANSYTGSLRSRAFIYSYALAVSEENASGGKIVTAPTCGASGVLPAVLYHLHKNHSFSRQRILRALATAGLVGNIVKTNASISGAEVGCQGEVGVACSMAAAAATQLFGGTVPQIEYAAEMGLEHHLGLTCDPVCGLVQVPCIERNAFAAVRALDSCSFAMLSDGTHLIKFDKVLKVMKQTGHDLPSLYKETSQGGLALDWNQKSKNPEN